MNDELKYVRKELEADILNKLNKIKDLVITGSPQESLKYIEVLAMANDELSDVLLNWEPRVLENDLDGIDDMFDLDAE